MNLVFFRMRCCILRGQVLSHLITRETQRLEEMIHEMLDFPKPLELHLSEGDVTTVLNQSVEIVANAAKRRAVTVQMKSS